jgi:hypothetical protein
MFFGNRPLRICSRYDDVFDRLKHGRCRVSRNNLEREECREGTIEPDVVTGRTALSPLSSRNALAEHFSFPISIEYSQWIEVMMLPAISA